jgi:hypothetical protein
VKQISDKRRAKLAAEGIEFPTSTFATKPKKSTAKGRRDTGPDRATAERVAERESQGCAVCGKFLDGPRGSAWSVHHRVRRGQGVDNALSNLLAVCGGRDVQGCHQQLHDSPAKARKGGWILRGSDDPKVCKVAHYLFGWVLLLDDGTVAEAVKP